MVRYRSPIIYLSKEQICREAEDLLCRWSDFIGQKAVPPIPVEAIAEKHLGITLEYDDLGEILGLPDVLGATWVDEKRIVINKSIDYHRTRKVKFEALDESHEALEEDDQVNEDEMKVQLKKIKKAIEMLSDGYRIVLSLYLLEGYDHEEIGQILQISASGSRSQLARAKQKLLELLNMKL